MLTLDDIQDRIPHRFENLLLDSCTIPEPNVSEFTIDLQTGDALGRDIFLYNMAGSFVVPTPLLAEIAALACIVSAGKIPDGTFAYFAAITQFSRSSSPFKASHTIHGSTKKISDKNGFFKYQFSIKNQDSAESNGQLMAFYDTSGSTDVETGSPIELSTAITNDMATPPVALPSNPSKVDHMTFINACHMVSPTSALYAYTYPNDHPLVRGHFPSNPVMMGVCQWQMLEDAMTHYFNHFNQLFGASTIVKKRCDAIIFKSDGTPVCDIKSANIMGNKHSDRWHAFTSMAKKVLFKQRVLPGDQLFLSISSIETVESI